MSDTGCEGFSNYETFLVAQYIDNTSDRQNFFYSKAREHIQAANNIPDRAEITFQYFLSSFFEDETSATTDHWSSLLFQHAYQNIQWQDIAEHILAKIEKDDAL